MIQVRNLSLRRGGRTVLRDVSLDVRTGEILGIVGSNGAGKSTLLSALAGELRPETGTIRVGGRDLTGTPPVERARFLALLPQENHLDFPYTAFEVVELGRLPHGGRGEGIAAAALAVTGASHLAHRSFPTLSGGERQRVHLARVLAQLWEDPGTGRVLLLDEPTASLDPAHQHGTLELARSHAREGFAVVVVLHDLNLAARYCDRILLLHGGGVAGLGSPRGVLNTDIIYEVFGIRAEVLAHPRHDCPLIVA